MGALAFSCLATAFAFCNVGAKSEQRRAMKTTAAKGAAVMAVTAQAQALKLVAQLLSAAIVAATLGGALQICCSLAGRLFLCFAAPIPLTPGRVAALAVTLAGLARIFGLSFAPRVVPVIIPESCHRLRDMRHGRASYPLLYVPVPFKVMIYIGWGK